MSQRCEYKLCEFHDPNSDFCHRAMCLATQTELRLMAIIRDQELTILNLTNELEKHQCLKRSQDGTTSR